MPHLLTYEQNRLRVKVAKTLIQMFQTYDKKQFADFVAGDKNRVYYFEPVRKVSNKISATKHSIRPIIAKRSLSARKVWYAIYFSGEGVAIKVPVERQKHHRKVLQRHSTGEAEKTSERPPCHWFLTYPSSSMAMALLMPLK